MVSPLEFIHLTPNPRTSECDTFGVKGFIEVIRALINRLVPYKQRKLSTDTAQREDGVKTQRGDGHLQARERGLEQIFPLQSEAIKPANTLILDFWPSEL